MAIIRFIFFAVLLVFISTFFMRLLRAALRVGGELLLALAEASSASNSRRSRMSENAWRTPPPEPESRGREERSQNPQPEAMQTLDAFNVLEISRSASREEISRAFKRKMSQNHPDKVAGMDSEFQELANERAKQITAAYQRALKDSAH